MMPWSRPPATAMARTRSTGAWMPTANPRCCWSTCWCTPSSATKSSEPLGSHALERDLHRARFEFLVGAIHHDPRPNRIDHGPDLGSLRGPPQAMLVVAGVFEPELLFPGLFDLRNHLLGLGADLGGIGLIGIQDLAVGINMRRLDGVYELPVMIRAIPVVV